VPADSDYRDKRNFGRTPETTARPANGRAPRFFLQKLQASTLHDVRAKIRPPFGWALLYPYWVRSRRGYQRALGQTHIAFIGWARYRLGLTNGCLVKAPLGAQILDWNKVGLRYRAMAASAGWGERLNAED